jgi:hypothetical protein
MRGCVIRSPGYPAFPWGLHPFPASFSRSFLLSDPDSLRVGRGLVSRNIAYPKGLKFKPRLNAYRLIISQWLDKGAPPSPADVLNVIR